MEPSVRGPRTQSGIAAAPVPKPRITVALKSEFRVQCGPTSRSITAAGNRIFGCGDRAPKTATKMRERPQRPRSGKRVAGNPRRNALFGVVSETRGLRRLDGGRTRARTWAPLIKSQQVQGGRLALDSGFLNTAPVSHQK